MESKFRRPPTSAAYASTCAMYLSICPCVRVCANVGSIENHNESWHGMKYLH